LLCFGVKGKLGLSYIGPFEVVRGIRFVAYQLVLPLNLNKIHNFFHVLLLWKAKIDQSRVLPQVPIEIEKDLTLEIKLVRMLDHDEKEIRNKKIYMVKVSWRSSPVEECGMYAVSCFYAFKSSLSSN
jgi:hypothetical protein